tara:strand:- start:675 stop:1400 length:726 start_codon:yes stop_codon:yes gene_type:complete
MEDNRLNKIRLNRFIALCGICSRRKADEMISQGLVKVNKTTISKLGFHVSWYDEILVNGEKIQPEKQQYILLNKPKGYITTMSDEKNRKTVISLIKPSFKERLFPVGRLDKDTTGLLLFTNDGVLAKELTHPKHEVRKIYNVSLNKSVSQRDMEAIKSGVKLEDGLMKTDDIRYIDNSQKIVQLTIHSGKNRIIRRLFNFFNYDVKKLDRVGYSFLKKDNLRQGKWRRLTAKEVIELKKNH